MERVAIADRGIRKTVQLLHLEVAAGERAHDGAAALGAEIEGQVLPHSYTGNTVNRRV